MIEDVGVWIRTLPSVYRARMSGLCRSTLCASGPDKLWRNLSEGNEGDTIAASYSYFNAVIGSTRDARCAGMKPAHSATSASATAESASTAGSAPVI